MELYQLPAHKLLKLMKNKEISPSDISLSILKRIKEVEGKVKSFVSFDEEELNKKRNFDPEKPLSCIPIARKDNICQKGKETTCASKILKGFVSPYDATVIEKLKEAGAFIFATSNMDEFAFGSSTETSCYGPTFNPWDLNRVPGGSSGGSASAVSSGETIMALGSDTGGSIRQPASLCGVVGLKPTYGRVSRYGLIAFASSLDQIGPLTKDVKDAALILKVISGYDKRDSTSSKIPVPDFLKGLEKEIRGVRIGVINESFKEGVENDVKESISKSIKLFEDLGAKVNKISLPLIDYSISCYYILAPAEASSNLARFDGVRYGLRFKAESVDEMYKKTRGLGFGKEAKRRIILGTYVLSAGYYEAYYLKALKVRYLIKNQFENFFKKFDVLICPTSPTTAFKIGEKIDDPISMYLSDIFTVPINLAGLPAISIPCGFSKDNLPIGLQIIGRPFDEETILRVAYHFERETDYHLKRPPL
jgi:aspartyl-tRNA(Asn)/glutamyl-tRNA(Gln) amidotransferase subunit A